MIRIESLSYRYRKDLPLVLNSINLEVKKGESVLICGDSGSGKSTLLHCINGIVPYLLGGGFEGKVLIDGEEGNQNPFYKRPHKVGTVFQNYEDQIFMPRVKEDVIFGCRNAGLDNNKAEGAASEALEAFGMSTLNSYEVEELSAGQKQRLAIAGIYALKPPVMLFDEPFMNLDHNGRKDFIAILHKLKEKNTTVVVTESDGSEINHLFDSAFLLQKGSIDTSCVHDMETRVYSPANNKFGAEILNLDHISFAYNKDKYVLDDVNISLRKGECIAIVGENGSGKTTLFKLIAGVLKPNRGSIKAFGFTNYSVDDIVGKLGFLFQNPDEQLFASSVQEEIEFGPRLLNKRIDINGYLEQYGLIRYKDSHPHSLSKGERQRVAFLSGLSMGPEIIILDEPTTGLDRKNWRKLMDDAKHTAKLGQGVIFSTHNMNVVDEYADRVITLSKGRIISDEIRT